MVIKAIYQNFQNMEVEYVKSGREIYEGGYKAGEEGADA